MIDAYPNAPYRIPAEITPSKPRILSRLEIWVKFNNEWIFYANYHNVYKNEKSEDKLNTGANWPVFTAKLLEEIELLQKFQKIGIVEGIKFVPAWQE